MNIMRSVKRRAQAALPPLVFAALTAYFCWNATRGEHGLKTYALRQQQLVEARAGQIRAEAVREELENRVGGLRTNHIDTDTLDERARLQLNLADPTDIVVPYGQGKELFK
jgi:cell division protein FtsB